MAASTETQLTDATKAGGSAQGGSRRGRWLRNLSFALLLASLLVFADIAVTLLWQEPLTALVGKIDAAGVNKRYLTKAPLTASQRHQLARQSRAVRLAETARVENQRVPDGAGVARIVIPRLHVGYTVIQGTNESDLEKGPGHYRGTALPGQGRTVAIAGHRTTYLAPFRWVNELKPGDPIEISTAYGRFTYRVQMERSVLPTDVSVVRDVGYDRLVLSTCDPPFSAAHRLIVFARLVGGKRG